MINELLRRQKAFESSSFKFHTQFACSKTRSPQYRVVLVHVFFAKTAPPADFFRVKHFLAEIHVIIK